MPMPRADVNASGARDPRYREGRDHSSGSIQADNDAASRVFPSVEVPGAPELRLHVYKERDGDGWAVWLNTEVSDFDGLCLALGSTRDAAVADAVKGLEAVLEKLQGPSW
jgi:hypothetical protein